MSYRRYSGDPHWITLKYPGKCRRCGRDLKPGYRAFRYKTGDLYCNSPKCGGQCEVEFESAAADEAFMNLGMDGGP